MAKNVSTKDQNAWKPNSHKRISEHGIIGATMAGPW